MFILAQSTQTLRSQLHWVFLGYVGTLFAAVAVLIIGIFVAYVVAAGVRWALARTTLDDRLVLWLRGTPEAEPAESERWVARIVFWLIVLLALVGFFQVLDIPAVSGPFTLMLAAVFGFIPRLFAAGLLLAVAWVVATGLRMLVVRALRTTRIDERIARQLAEPPPDRRDTVATGMSASAGARRPRTALSDTFGSVAYGLVFLLFLPMVLDALGMQGLLGPVAGMIGRLLNFLPDLLAATLILAVGYVAARIVRRVVTGLLQAAGADRLGSRLGLERAGGRYGLSELLGYLVFVLILLPVVVQALDALRMAAVTAPARDMLARVLNALPGLAVAAALLAVAYFVGRLLAAVAANVLASLGFDAAFRRWGLAAAPVVSAGPSAPLSPAEVEAGPAAGARVYVAPTPETPASAPLLGTAPWTPSRVVGYALFAALMLVAAQAALDVLGLPALSMLVSRLLAFLGSVGLGAVVIALGVVLANLAARWIRGSGAPGASVAAAATRIAILVLVVAMGVETMGVGHEILRNAVTLLVAGLALAVGLAFGLGGRDVADLYLRKWTGRAEAAVRREPPA